MIFIHEWACVLSGRSRRISSKEYRFHFSFSRVITYIKLEQHDVLVILQPTRHFFVFLINGEIGWIAWLGSIDRMSTAATSLQDCNDAVLLDLYETLSCVLTDEQRFVSRCSLGSFSFLFFFFFEIIYIIYIRCLNKICIEIIILGFRNQKIREHFDFYVFSALVHTSAFSRGSGGNSVRIQL